MPTGEYHDCLPKFAGNNVVTVEDHLNAFLKFVDDLEIEHEDVVMKMFMQTLEGDTRAWYKALPVGSINGWDSFQRKFTERWVDKQDNSYLLDAFSSIRKEENETVSEFNTNFQRFITGFLIMLGLMLKLCYYIILNHLMDLSLFCLGRRNLKLWTLLSLLQSRSRKIFWQLRKSSYPFQDCLIHKQGSPRSTCQRTPRA
jgi:hypothetical protein